MGAKTAIPVVNNSMEDDVVNNTWLTFFHD